MQPRSGSGRDVSSCRSGPSRDRMERDSARSTDAPIGDRLLDRRYGRLVQLHAHQFAVTRSTAHEWEFAPRFRRNAFGWQSQAAIKRVREAVTEIKAVARRDPVLAATGAVLFLEKVSPALEQVDSSSGAEGLRSAMPSTHSSASSSRLPSMTGLAINGSSVSGMRIRTTPSPASNAWPSTGANCACLRNGLAAGPIFWWTDYGPPGDPIGVPGTTPTARLPASVPCSTPVDMTNSSPSSIGHPIRSGTTASGA